MRSNPINLGVRLSERALHANTDHRDANRRFLKALTDFTHEGTLLWHCLNLREMRQDIALPLLFTAAHADGTIILVVTPIGDTFLNDPSDPDASTNMNFSLMVESDTGVLATLGNSHQIGINTAYEVTEDHSYSATDSFALLHEAVLAALKIIPRSEIIDDPVRLYITSAGAERIMTLDSWQQELADHWSSWPGQVGYDEAI